MLYIQLKIYELVKSPLEYPSFLVSITNLILDYLIWPLAKMTIKEILYEESKLFYLHSKLVLSIFLFYIVNGSLVTHDCSLLLLFSLHWY